MSRQSLCSPTQIPTFAPRPAGGTRCLQLKLRLDGSIDSWLPSDTIKLKRNVGARLGVQNTDNIIVDPRAGSIVVVLTVLEGAQIRFSYDSWGVGKASSCRCNASFCAAAFGRPVSSIASPPCEATRTHTHTHTHARTHARTHTHTNTHRVRLQPQPALSMQ